MIAADPDDAELILIFVLKIIPHFVIHCFTQNACEQAAKRIMLLWYERAGRDPKGYGAVLRQFAKMIQLGR